MSLWVIWQYKCKQFDRLINTHTSQLNSWFTYTPTDTEMPTPLSLPAATFDMMGLYTHKYKFCIYMCSTKELYYEETVYKHISILQKCCNIISVNARYFTSGTDYLFVLFTACYFFSINPKIINSTCDHKF